MQLHLHELSDFEIVQALAQEDSNIEVVTAYVRMLADYRFGSRGEPLKTDHSDLSRWTVTDAIAIWHGYRYGVVGVSPPGAQGFDSVAEFQNRQPNFLTALDAGIFQGSGAGASVLGAVSIMTHYVEDTP